MSKFGSTQELYARIGEHLQKLKQDTLQVEDFENLLLDARELYERAQILRYKAFERHASGEKVVAIPEASEQIELLVHQNTPHVEDETPSASTPKDTEQIIVSDDEPGFEFALFGEIADAVIPENSPKKEQEDSNNRDRQQEEEKTTEPLSVPDSKEDNKVEVHQPDVVSDTPKTEYHAKVVEVRVQEHKITSSSGGSLLDKFASNHSSRLADQLKNSRIASIASSLNLNDRIRFAKNLFAGNSETFNSAVQLLDAQNSKMEAFALLGEYAERFNWDQDDKNTMDFYELVERRHA